MTSLNAITLEDIPLAFRIREATPQPNLEHLKETVLALSDRITRLLPIEQFEKENLLKQLQPLKRELADASSDRIDLGFLKAQRRQKTFRIGDKSYSKVYDCFVPKFALFTLDSVVCTFSVKVELPRPGQLGSLIPKTIGILPHLFGLWDSMPEPDFGREYWKISHNRELWQEVEQRSSRQWKYSTDYTKYDGTANCLLRLIEYCQCERGWGDVAFDFTVSTVFTGGLPDEIREQIPVWHKLYDEVLLCREAADWTVNVEVTRLPIRGFGPDPLVIGRIDDDYWLLAKFDTTTAEEWVSNEWTLRRR